MNEVHEVCTEEGVLLLFEGHKAVVGEGGLQTGPQNADSVTCY